MTGFPFRRRELAGWCGRVVRIETAPRGTASAEPWSRMATSAQAKRRRILEEARSAVLDRIRRTR